MKKEEMAISESKNWPADAGAAARTGEWLDGTVMMVEPSRELLFVRANDTRQKVGIHWAAGTQFVLRGQPASSAVLRIGQRLHIHCRLADQQLRADEISIEPPSTGSGQAPLGSRGASPSSFLPAAARESREPGPQPHHGDER
jgi:hypothetical protein